MNVLRNLACGLSLASLCACGGGGGGVFGNNPVFNGSGGIECVTGTSQELARPAAGAYAPNTGTIEIVASGSNNSLYSSYQNWYVYVQNAYDGQQISGGQLSLVSDPTGPHPYGSDYYYSSQLQSALPSGQTWNVFLTQYSGSCAAVPLQSFST